jgi:ATPase family AAA domain-containing protein 3A/B
VARAQADMERTRWEEQRKTMQEQGKVKAQLAEYEDQLARKRQDSEHEKQRARQVSYCLFVQEGEEGGLWQGGEQLF